MHNVNTTARSVFMFTPLDQMGGFWTPRGGPRKRQGAPALSCRSFSPVSGRRSTPDGGQGADVPFLSAFAKRAL